MRQAGVENFAVIEGGPTSGGPGTGTDTRGCAATSSRTSTCRSWRSSATSRRRSTPGERRSSPTVQRIARHFDLYRNAALSTLVTASSGTTTPLGGSSAPTERRMKVKFVCLAGGILHRPKLPGIPGSRLQGPLVPHQPLGLRLHRRRHQTAGLTKLPGKRVGIIGTGATAIQCVPHLAQSADELFVFQRTPSTVDERNNKPTDPGWAASLEPGWQKRRTENFTHRVRDPP